jgi:FtsZ-binding cell division protein ZapB
VPNVCKGQQMKITLDQFQQDFVTGLDSVVVGAQWLQDLLKERDKLEREVNELKKTNEALRRKADRWKDEANRLQLQDKNIYILDTLA